MATRLWFLRHGEVEARHLGRFLGRTDAGLSDLGRHQAEAVAAFLEDAPVDAVVSSPLQRARATAGPLAHGKGLDVEVRPAFAEMDFGDWEDRTWEEIEGMDGTYAAAWQADPGPHACPGGQSPDGFAAGVAQELRALREEFAGRTVVLAAHAGVNRAVLADVLACPYMEAFRFAQDYGCINAVGWQDDGWGQVALVNLVPGPRSDHDW